MIPQQSDHIVRLRAALVWLTTTAGAVVAGRLLIPTAREVTTSTTFEGAVVALCAAMTVAAAAGLWVAVTGAVVDVLRAPRAAAVGRPGAVRRFVLVACGIAMLSAPHVATAATGDPGVPGLAGLPLPDRAVGHGLAHLPSDAPDARPSVTPTGGHDQRPRATVHVVRTGDSLWQIARTRLPAAATPVVASYVDRLHRSNRDRIGADPDLIRPGQRLQLPETDVPPAS